MLPPQYERMIIYLFIFCCVYSGLHALCLSLCFFACVFLFCVLCMCVCVHAASVHVGKPRLGVGGEEGGSSAPAASGTSGRGQCGLCCSRHGGDVHLPLAAGALRLSVRPAGLVQHCGRLWQQPQRARAPKQAIGKSHTW